MTAFTREIHEALDYAAMYHRGQYRKDPDIRIPYISHLFGVAYILAGRGLSQDVIIAGVLHDFLEDVVQKRNMPGLAKEMKKKFGKPVFTLVSYVTQRKKDRKGRKIDWHTRVEMYRAIICSPDTPGEAKAISCADKIHNIESLLMALDRHRGHEQDVWAKLKATPEEQVRKFEQLHDGMGKTWSDPLLDLLANKIALLKKAADVSGRTPAIFRTKLTGRRGASTPRRQSLD